MSKIGLVFSGGGGKGAYQIGVWKALEEFGIAKNITVVSGTSVGALNAALFAQGCYQTAEKAWLSISSSDILHLDISQILKHLLNLGLSPNKISALGVLLKTGIFSRAGLERIIDDFLDANKISTSAVKAFSHCSRTPFSGNGMKLTGDVFRFDNDAKKDIRAKLLASSAIPVVFGTEKINGQSYIDGYFTDNTPINPIYAEGCGIIINIFLGRTGGLFDDCYIDHRDYPNATIIDVVPQDDPGGLFTGVLSFNKIPDKIEKGYQDARRIFQPIWDMQQAQFRYSNTSSKFKNHEASWDESEASWNEHEERSKQVDKKLATNKNKLMNELDKW